MGTLGGRHEVFTKVGRTMARVNETRRRRRGTVGVTEVVSFREVSLSSSVLRVVGPVRTVEGSRFGRSGDSPPSTSVRNVSGLS